MSAPSLETAFAVVVNWNGGDGNRDCLDSLVRSGVAAECIPPSLVAAMQTVLRSSDLKLAQQYWVRTDYRPPPYNDCPGMHSDHACLPWQREATPQQTYYLCQLALNDILQGGAATMVGATAFRGNRDRGHRAINNRHRARCGVAICCGNRGGDRANVSRTRVTPCEIHTGHDLRDRGSGSVCGWDP